MQIVTHVAAVIGVAITPSRNLLLLVSSKADPARLAASITPPYFNRLKLRGD